ncbi:hypothetical protein [Rubrivirga sp.]|uniref:hypothetical protein n=1 Tax=Rubrivirga sp. TaxID=1885344 RepID=UPI003C77E00B
MDYAILPGTKLILERLSGPISYLDLVSLTEQVWNDELYDKSYSAIIDIRHASFDMGPSSLKSFARLILDSESASEGQVAVISSKLTETALSYLLAEKLTKGGVVSVFSTWEGVVAHLGLSEPVRIEIADERAYDAMFN